MKKNLCKAERIYPQEKVERADFFVSLLLAILSSSFGIGLDLGTCPWSLWDYFHIHNLTYSKIGHRLTTLSSRAKKKKKKFPEPAGQAGIRENKFPSDLSIAK